jgi:hypothetical protein
VKRALAVYRLAHGAYPSSLDPLIADRLLREQDLRFPFQERYFYRLDGNAYVLLRPIR